MSHLQFPRLHFRGQFSTNVGTANNDDLGNPQYVDSALVQVDTQGMTDAAFATWLRQIDPSFGIRGGWNVYGDSGCRFVDAACHATEPAAGGPLTTAASDPAVGAAVNLVRGVMADQDPEGTTSTQILAAEFNLTNPAAGVSIVGRPTRAVSRWVARRNLGVSGFRAFAAVWHAVLRPEQLTITAGNSPSLLALKAAHDSGKGLFVRYCTYLLAPLLSASQLAADFAAGLATINPAVGKLLGTIGVWDPATMTTLAEGRRLGSGALATSNHASFRFNPATVCVDSANRRVSVDLINSIPEVDETLEKVNLGPLDLTLTSAGGAATVLGTIPSTRADYERRAGIADFDIPAGALPDIDAGRLDVIQRSTGSALLTETPLVLETDDRAVYLQEGGNGSIRLRGWLRGQPAGGKQIAIRQFFTTNKTFAPAPPATAIVSVVDQVVLDATGSATIALAGAAPGCGTLQFGAVGDVAAPDFFACVRVLPKDDFSGIPDDQVTFAFVYDKVLRYYHLLHPAMDRVFDLSSEGQVELRADRIRTRIKVIDWSDPQYMPRTRELSAGKATLLLRWCDIVSPPSDGPSLA
jgi:hypothetical protein